MYSHTTVATPQASLPSSPPAHRKPAQPIRLQPIGVDPSCIVGKVLTRIRKSPVHPSVTLDFADRTTFQVRVDGYDPVHRGIPKVLETNAVLHPLFHPPGGEIDVHLTVTHSRFVAVRDTAHDLRSASQSRWNVEHLALAIKFEEQEGWHCVWATMAEYDGRFGPCMFRSFDDVYLDEIVKKPPRKHRARAQRHHRPSQQPKA